MTSDQAPVDAPAATVTIDGNEAAAIAAYALNEVIAIYPITPASPMGEAADQWSAFGKPNHFGSVPQVIEMQSEGGAAGAIHGALQGGALATTFTASQGLLLMIPNMYKIAGELTAGVIHVAARSIATHALSIFGDHSDVMAARGTGYAMLCASTVQEAHDFALLAQCVTLKARIPVLHFFDGFRTSHEINKIDLLSADQIESLIDRRLIAEHRQRSLDPDRPVLRGSAQNPDVFFQAREAIQPFYEAFPELLREAMNRFAEQTGRRYQPFDYLGHPEAERVLVMMGSGCGAAEEAVEALVAQGEPVGLLKVRLFRPFDAQRLIHALPPTTQRIAVLDRMKEPGATGEPLYQEVVCAVAEAWNQMDDRSDRRANLPEIRGGRYGLSSKEFTPAMAHAVLQHLGEASPKRHFTIGIYDDVSQSSLPWDESTHREPDDVTRAVFFGLGSDGTVGANKNSVKIIGRHTPLHAQGYFVYDSHKAGAMTVSHLRFSPRPIRSTYLIREANFVACHQFEMLQHVDILDRAADEAVFLLNSPYGPDEVWQHLPGRIQQQILDKRLRLYVIDAARIAQASELGGRINTVMQACFFALCEVMPVAEALDHIRAAISQTYGKRGKAMVERNHAAVDATLEELREVAVPDQATGPVKQLQWVPDEAPDFVRRVTDRILAGQGDLLPVSAMPIDGTFPTGTARYEKRSIATHIPIWDPSICIECGLCALVCPHATIRIKRYDSGELQHAPEAFPFRSSPGRDGAGDTLTVQVAPDDCTGCGVCVDVCPAKSKQMVRHKAIDLLPKNEHLKQERQRFEFFLEIPDTDPRNIKADTVKGSQLLLPLFEYSGACAGCGETPYLKLMSQLFGDRAVIANATGCSSIFGGNLPTTPWTKDTAGRGPAWSNSLFEDNAEFGLGIRMALDSKRARAEHLLRELANSRQLAGTQQSVATLADDVVRQTLESPQTTAGEIAAQRERVAAICRWVRELKGDAALELETLLDTLVRRSLWIVGGDGWAYDIGYGGLDHVLASGRDVNILVLDTGVYSNTGGQASKSTPRAASAKFAANGRSVRRKDLGLMAAAYGSVYVAQVAIGANPAQTLRAFHEAESFHGPSLILAYSHCVAHGINMETSMTHQRDLVRSGFWPLYRYDPRHAHAGDHPFHLDSHKPTLPFVDVAMQEARFAMLARSKPEHAQRLMALAQKDIDDTWHYYEQLAGVEREFTNGASDDA